MSPFVVSGGEVMPGYGISPIAVAGGSDVTFGYCISPANVEHASTNISTDEATNLRQNLLKFLIIVFPCKVIK